MASLSKKIASIALGDLIGRGFGFITTVYLARVLGTEGYGFLTIGLSFMGYLVFASDLGLHKIGAREVAKLPELRIFRTIELFAMRIILALSVFVISYLIIKNLAIPEPQKSMYIGFTFTLIPHAFLLEWYFNGQQQFLKTAYSKAIYGMTYFGLVFFFVHSINDLQIVPLLLAVGLTASTLLLFLFSYFDKPFVLPFRGIQILRDLFQSSVTLGSGLFFNQVIQLLPPILIGFFLSPKDAGIYGAAFRVIIIAMIIDRIFVQLLLPNLAKIWSTNTETANTQMQYSARLMLLIGGSLAITIAVGSEYFIQVLFGEEFANSSTILTILSLYLFLTFQNSLFSYGLVALGKDRAFFTATSTGGVITLFLILLAAYSFNLKVIAFAIVLGEGIISAISYFKFNQFTKLTIVAPVSATLILGILIYYLSTYYHFNPLLEVPVSLVLFFIGLISFKVVTKTELTWIKSKFFG
jgi:O-antigen/teichoic acid export membrane protein